VSALVDKKVGDRMRQNMTLKEERLFLDRYFEPARSGSLVTSKEVKPTQEESLGHGAHESTIYRLQNMHQWRKVVPDPGIPRTTKGRQNPTKKLLRWKGSAG
jgi:hypothetical protein